MDGSGMDICISFGVRTYGSTVSDYVDIVDDEVLHTPDGYLRNTTQIELILDLWETALNDLRTSETSSNMTTIKNDLGSDSKVWGYHIEEPNWEDHDWPSDKTVRRAKTILSGASGSRSWSMSVPVAGEGTKSNETSAVPVAAPTPSSATPCQRTLRYYLTQRI